MKTSLFLVPALALCACSSAPRTALREDYARPVASWVSERLVRLPLNSVSEAGTLDFYIVSLSFNGIESRFMVDTGSNVTWVTPEFAASQGGHNTRQKMFSHGVGGNSKPGIIRFDSADLGFVVLRPLDVVTGPILTEMNKMLLAQKETPVVGILGLDVLVPLGASVNLISSDITFLKPPKRNPPTP